MFRKLSSRLFLQRKMSSSYEKGLDAIKLQNKALKELPVEESKRPGTRKVSGACFSLVNIVPVEGARLVASSKSALKLLDVDESAVKDQDLADYFSGNKLLPNSTPASHCYCGHQFGYFAGQLGDGTVAYLGDLVNSTDETWELQLKGVGHTPFSRQGDGRKVLRSSIREFLCSEAMHFLRIPSTRAGTIVDSDYQVTRDMFYDGRAKRENSAFVLRIAPTFIRFGSFEIFKPRDSTSGKSGSSVGNVDLLRQMLRYVIEGFYPEVAAQFPNAGTEQYLNFYRQVCIKTAHLVAKWQCVGFCHGVLNTDNMSIMGLTIDYGPYGFLDFYDPDFICNTTDQEGRYSFKNQPEICEWNLEKFAEALQDVLPLSSSKQVLDEVYQEEFKKSYREEMRAKLGLCEKQTDKEDEEIAEKLLSTMQETYADYTNTFRNLSKLNLPGSNNFQDSVQSTLDALVKNCPNLENLKIFAKPSMSVEQLESFQTVIQQNPGLLAMIGGGGTIKQEIEKLEKFKSLENLSEADYQSMTVKKWSDWLEIYIERLKKETEGKSDLEELDKKRKNLMNSSNPKYILRNYIAQNAIEEAEKGNYLEVRNVLKRLEHPFDEPGLEGESPPLYGFRNILYDATTPASSMGMQLS